MSWDDDDAVPTLPSAPAPAINFSNLESWENVDLDAIPVAAPAPAPAAAPAQPERIKEKHVAKAKAKDLKSKDQQSTGQLCPRCEAEVTPLADANAEKKRLENLQIKADMAAAQSLVGGVVDNAATIEKISIVSADDFAQLAKLIGARVHDAAGPRSTSLIMRFYSELLATAGTRISVQDLSALSTLIDSMKNRKLQEEKAKSKSKTKAKGSNIRVERNDMDFYDDVDSGSQSRPTQPVSSSGNVGNVSLSMAAAGLSASEVGEASSTFTRQKFSAEDDFM